uniref:Uncharacterized protein n=1 Tax=Cannabis sativa TaxID=3483 RepID=A0A803QC97_CANSA
MYNLPLSQVKLSAPAERKWQQCFLCKITSETREKNRERVGERYYLKGNKDLSIKATVVARRRRRKQGVFGWCYFVEKRRGGESKVTAATQNLKEVRLGFSSKKAKFQREKEGEREGPGTRVREEKGLLLLGFSAIKIAFILS